MSAKAHILIIDDDANTLASLSRAFRLAGHEAAVCDNAIRALELAKNERFDLILSDVVMPGRDGIALLEDFKSSGLTTPVVMMSGQASIEIAVKATRLGASDFLEKPISSDKLLLTVENALRLKHLEQENRDLKRRLGRHHIVWGSSAMKEVMAQVEHVAASETRVCIRGESGTGKELIARTLHEKSPRRAESFISLNCAAVPSELMETELFGHEKGSFTGAASRHTGKFEQAHRGTLFLDEIGDMPPAMQAKLLRVLEEGEIERVGGDKPFAVDVRVVVATHRNLEEQVRQGTFREDLYHRVFVFPIVLPPLRERMEDVPDLIRHFFAQAEREGLPLKQLDQSALDRLKRYRWPGNVRELENLGRRLAALYPQETISAAVIDTELAQPMMAAIGDDPVTEDNLSTAVERYLSRYFAGFDADLPPPGLYHRILREVEYPLLSAALAATRGNQIRAADLLGVNRNTLRKKIRDLDIQVIRSST